MDDVQVVSAASLGDIAGVGNLMGEADHTGITVQVIAGGAANPQITPLLGDFLFQNLLAGSYDLRFSRAGYESEDVIGVPVTPGSTTDVGVVVLPEPSHWLLLVSGCAGLICLHRRRSREQH
jgi:hypothetical protein